MLRPTLSAFVLLSLTVIPNVNAAKVSSFAGATTTFQFPPANITDVAPNTSEFPGADVVGFPGATPTGDEAEAIQTAPALAPNQNVFPLLGPTSSQQKTTNGFNVLRFWGNLSPWYSVLNSERANDPLPHASPQIPSGCTLEQVHLLHRHGARYPTGGSAPAALAATIHSLVQNGTGLQVSGPLSFLSTWEYRLGAEILTPFGREQLFDLGVGFRVKYGELLKKGDSGKLPAWRTTSENRMIQSSLHFAAGFFGVSSYQSSYHQVITVEQKGFNNTLASDQICANADLPIGNLGNVQAPKWAAIYTKPAIKRLQPFIKGLTLNATHIVAMQQTCAYETVALGYSAFCELFDETDWKGFEYFIDVQFFYSNGPGNPTVPAQGIGWVQELVSRLSATPITNFDTSVNASIVSNRDLFPLGNDQAIYVDTSHDTDITAMLTAMNLTSIFGSALPTDHIPAKQAWVVSELAPFGTNVVGQVVSCPSSGKSTKFIRIIINDRVVPLTGIAHCQTFNKDGLCTLDNFVKGLQQRVKEVDFQNGCFGNLTIPKL